MVTASDADGDLLVYALSGDDAGLFELVTGGSGGSLSVAAGARLSYESATSHALTVTATDPSGLSAAIAVTVDVTDVEEAPIWGTEAPTLTNKFSTSVTVGWVSPDVTDRPPVVRFELTAAELDNAGDIKITVVITRTFVDDGSATSGTLTGLKPSTGYDVSVAGRERGGECAFGERRVHHAASERPSEGLRPGDVRGGRFGRESVGAGGDAGGAGAAAWRQLAGGPVLRLVVRAGELLLGPGRRRVEHVGGGGVVAAGGGVAGDDRERAVAGDRRGGHQAAVRRPGGARGDGSGGGGDGERRSGRDRVAAGGDHGGGVLGRRVVPSFGTQAADQTYQLGAAITSLVLPAASGGDLGHGPSGDVFDYVYALSGTLPSGLRFDAETRTLSGTPASWGRFAMTYTAQDADLEQGASDTASQTFSITVPPRVTDARYTSDPGEDGTYAIGDEIWMELLLGSGGGGVSVVGSPLPQLAVQVGDRERLASYAGGTDLGIDRYELDFRYTVQEGDADADGVSIGANALRINGATVATFRGVALSAEHDALPFDEVHRVDGVRPAVSSATVNGGSLTITFGEALDGGTEPAGSAFTVEGIGADQSPTGVSISGAEVRLTLGAGAVHSHSVTVDYEKPSSNALRDAAGNEAASFTGQVMNDTPDPPEPVVSGASVNGSTLTLTFDEALDTTASPPASVFSVGGTDAATSVTGVGFKSGDATKVELTLSPAVSHGDTGITVSYAKGTNPLKDGDGNEVASFTDQWITNDTLDPASAPAATAASVNGSTLTITFDEALDTTASPPASVFSVSGTDASTSVTAVGFKSGDATKLELTLSPAVEHGDTGITVSYTKGTNPLKDGDDNEVADFTDQEVTNDTPDTTSPTVSGASVDGSTLTLTFSEALDTRRRRQAPLPWAAPTRPRA